MNTRRRILIILTVMLAAVIALRLLSNAPVGNDLLVATGLCTALATFCFLRMPGKPSWVKILLCWSGTLCLALLWIMAETSGVPRHPYMGWFHGFILLFILPPLLLLEVLGIRLADSLLRQSKAADAIHQQFMAAIETGNLEQVKALLPGVYINDTNERGETALQLAVLSATDTIHPLQGAPMAIIRLLLQKSADATGCLNAMVNLHELYFEATDQDSDIYQAAVARAVELIPLLSAAGDTICKAQLESARYNCAPAIQHELEQVKLSPATLPEE